MDFLGWALVGLLTLAVVQHWWLLWRGRKERDEVEK